MYWLHGVRGLKMGALLIDGCTIERGLRALVCHSGLDVPRLSGTHAALCCSLFLRDWEPSKDASSPAFPLGLCCKSLNNHVLLCCPSSMHGESAGRDATAFQVIQGLILASPLLNACCTVLVSGVI